MYKLFVCICLMVSSTIFSQSYSIKKFNWQDAGFKGIKPVYTQTINIMNFGGDNTNTTANDIALNNAITALNNTGGIIYFPQGVYSFTSHININRDSITFKGAGYGNTSLRFNLNGNLNSCININGSEISTDTTSFSSAGVRDSNWVNVLNASAFNVGQWVHLQCNDNSYMVSNWAYGSLGQVMKIKNITGNKITFHSPFRFYYKLALNPRIKKLDPRKAIGFECMRIQRLDATSSQTSLFSYDKAVQCWINGIEGDSTNCAHVELNRCSNMDITNSYFHHAFAYGGSGQGYGIAIQASTSECKIENNIFKNLRHSVLFQSGANGNVFGYNYSFDPFWVESFLPSNSAGDIVMHGNYPFANLCEGNINQNTVIDNSHGKNGSYNTFFRNRSELYGVYMNTGPATDTTQLLGLEVTNMASNLGFYTTAGNGNLEFGNKIKNVLTPANTTNLVENSLYYSGNQRPLCFNTATHNWPVIGLPNIYNSNSNAAKDRFMLNIMAECICNNSIATAISDNDNNADVVTVYPNPAGNELKIKSEIKISGVCIYNSEGKLVLSKTEGSITKVDVAQLPPGLYLLSTKDIKGIKSHKFIKE